MSYQSSFELQFTILETRMPGPGFMGQNQYGPKTGSIYQSKPELGFRPKLVYQSKPKNMFQN